MKIDDTYAEKISNISTAYFNNQIEDEYIDEDIQRFIDKYLGYDMDRPGKARSLLEEFKTAKEVASEHEGVHQLMNGMLYLKEMLQAMGKQDDYTIFSRHHDQEEILKAIENKSSREVQDVYACAYMQCLSIASSDYFATQDKVIKWLEDLSTSDPLAKKTLFSNDPRVEAKAIQELLDSGKQNSSESEEEYPKDILEKMDELIERIISLRKSLEN